MRQFSPAELQNYLQHCEKDPVLVDVRESWEYDICRLADSILIPIAKLYTRPEQWERDQEIVLICHHGIRSYQAGLFLRSRGYSQIINLEGGLERWAKEIDPSMPRY